MSLKIIIVSMMLLSSFVTPAIAGDMGFDDFIPADPIQDMKDVGVWDLVLKILGLLTALVVVAAVAGLLLGVGKVSYHSTGNNSLGQKDAIMGMFFILGAVVVMVLLGGVFFYVWNGLT